MGALITRACLENQRNAAQWYAKARTWREAYDVDRNTYVRGTCRQFAINDQEAAARLSHADRLLRGLEC